MTDTKPVVCIKCGEPPTREVSAEMKSTNPAIYSDSQRRYKGTTGGVKCCDKPECAIHALETLFRVAREDVDFMTPFQPPPSASAT